MISSFFMFIKNPSLYSLIKRLFLYEYSLSTICSRFWDSNDVFISNCNHLKSISRDKMFYLCLLIKNEILKWMSKFFFMYFILHLFLSLSLYIHIFLIYTYISSCNKLCFFFFISNFNLLSNCNLINYLIQYFFFYYFFCILQNTKEICWNWLDRNDWNEQWFNIYFPFLIRLCIVCTFCVLLKDRMGSLISNSSFSECFL